jgi:MFS transporter, putative metabolite:H+ symporter
VAVLIDRTGRGPAPIGAFVGTVPSLAVLALACATSGGQVALFASCTTFFLYAINAGLYLCSPELCPTANRARGAAFGGRWNRCGVILGPVAARTLEELNA